MPKVTTTAGDELFYRDDAFTPPWEEPATTLLLHAEAETSLAWYGWVPRLAARGRVVRPDMRGAGRSAAMRPGQAWSLDRLASDVVALVDGLGVASVHLVAARLAGPVALRVAAAHPDLVETLVLCSAVADPAAAYGVRAARWVEQIERSGLDAWAVSAAAERLGAAAGQEELEGWAGILAGADRDALLGLLRNLPALDATADLARVGCPTLVVATDGSAAQPLEETTGWQRRIERSELLVLTGTGDHVAASHARDVAGSVLDLHKRSAKRDRAQKRGEGSGKRDRERRREVRQKERARG